jgi:hypothetical protein
MSVRKENGVKKWLFLMAALFVLAGSCRGKKEDAHGVSAGPVPGQEGPMVPGQPVKPVPYAQPDTPQPGTVRRTGPGLPAAPMQGMGSSPAGDTGGSDEEQVGEPVQDDESAPSEIVEDSAMEQAEEPVQDDESAPSEDTGSSDREKDNEPAPSEIVEDSVTEQAEEPVQDDGSVPSGDTGGSDGEQAAKPGRDDEPPSVGTMEYSGLGQSEGPEQDASPFQSGTPDRFSPEPFDEPVPDDISFPPEAARPSIPGEHESQTPEWAPGPVVELPVTPKKGIPLSVGLGLEANNNHRNGVAYGVQASIDYRLWRFLALGVRGGFSSNFGFSNTVEGEGFLRLILPLRGVDLFVQGGAGVSVMFIYEGNMPGTLFSGGVGARISLGARMYLEPAARFGVPFLWGAGITVGYRGGGAAGGRTVSPPARSDEAGQSETMRGDDAEQAALPLTDAAQELPVTPKKGIPLSVGLGLEANNNHRNGVAYGVQASIDYRLWRFLALGARGGFSSNFGFSNTVEGEGFLRLILPLRGVDLFVQGGAGVSVMFIYEGNMPGTLFSGGVGARISLGRSFYIEPAARFGVPFLWGAGISAGYRFGR